MKKKTFIILFVAVLLALPIFWIIKKKHLNGAGEKINENSIDGVFTGNHKKYTINPKIENNIYKAAITCNNDNVWKYDPTYYKLNYPNGDVPSGGACTDVVIRVLRKNGIDLQQLIHEDMSEHFDEYPNKWNLNKPDRNIDHRRVPNIMKYFERQNYNLTITNDADDYQPGDIVTWELSPGITHIGIIIENQDVFHNMGPTSRIQSDFLFSHTIIGHYRI
jgi:uncharacterized protein YijF (DUF1287 family)